jgi:Tol biopolymer transport system component
MSSLAQPSAAGRGRTLAVIVRVAEAPELAVIEPDGVVRSLGQRGILPRLVDAGYVLYNTTDGNLMALPVDPERLVATAGPQLVQDGITITPNAVGLWAASRNGTIIVDRGGGGVSELVAVDRTGRAAKLSDEVRRFRLPRASPDGQRIAVQAAGTAGSNADADIWILNRTTGALSRFTTGGGNSDPVWTPDGVRIAWAGSPDDTTAANRNSPAALRAVADIYWQPVDRTSPPEKVYGGPRPQWPWAFTPKGDTLVFDEGPGNARIRAFVIGSKDSAWSIVESEFSNRLGKLSPDGKWLTYTSNETGRMEVYVRRFPGPGGASQVSVDGGDQPMWSRDGRELFFRDGVSFIAAAMSQGTVRSRAVLFEDTFEPSNATNYDVLPGGGFVMLRGFGDGRKLSVMVNWVSEIARRAAAARR